MIRDKNRVLVTGCSGFTGKYVINALKASGYKVYGLASGNICPQIEPPCYFSVDMLNRLEIKELILKIQPNYVIHLAAKAFVAHENLVDFYAVNVLGTRYLLEALCGVKSQLKHIIIASSANIYGNTREGLFSELDSPNPVNDYAISKLAMEYVVKIFLSKLPITISRPFNYTGVGQDEHFIIPKIIKHFKAKANKIELGNIEVYREFNDVRDIASLYVKLLQARAGGIVNLCSGKYYSLRQILEICENLTDHWLKVKINIDYVRENELRILAGDASNLNQTLDYRPQYEIKDTLRWMLADKISSSKVL